MEGDQGGRLAAHFCINLQIDSIRRGETGEGGKQAVEDDKAPRAGHSTLSKLFRLWLLDEWSALWACIPFASTRFSFNRAYRALYLTSLLYPSSVFTDMRGDGRRSTHTHRTERKTMKSRDEHITTQLTEESNRQKLYLWIFWATTAVLSLLSTAKLKTSRCQSKLKCQQWGGAKNLLICRTDRKINLYFLKAALLISDAIQKCHTQAGIADAQNRRTSLFSRSPAEDARIDFLFKSGFTTESGFMFSSRL